MKHAVIIQTRYLGATNYLPSRIRSNRVGSKEVHTQPYEHELTTSGNHESAAKALLGAGETLAAISDNGNSGYFFTAISGEQL